MESKLTVPQFADLISCKSGNVYKIFAKDRVDQDLLMTISEVLQFDFFAIYSRLLQLDKTCKIKMSVEMDIPAEEWGTERLCEYCPINKKKLNQIENK